MNVCVREDVHTDVTTTDMIKRTKRTSCCLLQQWLAPRHHKGQICGELEWSRRDPPSWGGAAPREWPHGWLTHVSLGGRPRRGHVMGCSVLEMFKAGEVFSEPFCRFPGFMGHFIHWCSPPNLWDYFYSKRRTLFSYQGTSECSWLHQVLLFQGTF